MTQREKRKYLITALLKEQPQYSKIEIPSGLCKTYKTARSRGRNRQGENHACLTKKNKELLTSCYRSCLEPAKQNGLEKPYAHLLNIVKGQGYFVLTTNVGHQFQLAGFDKKRLFYAQGDYGLWQCSKACHDKTYDREEIVRRMVATQKNLKIPSELIPKCPVCGGKPL